MEISCLLSITEAAKIKGCSRQTIYDWIEKNFINVEKVAGRRLIVPDQKFQSMEARGARKEDFVIAEIKKLWTELSTTQQENLILKNKVVELEKRIEEVAV